MSGQFDDPARVIAFDTLELWSKDVAADIIAVEIQSHCDIDGESVPERVCTRVCEGLCREPCSLDPAACPSIGLMPRSRKPGSTVRIKGPAHRTSVGDLDRSIRVSIPCLLGEGDETRPTWLADPTPSPSPRISAFITVYLGDTSCLLTARLVSLF